MLPSSIRKISANPLIIGGRYVVERELGAGAAARVYLALDQRMNRPVAIKVLRDELARALGQRRFLREIQFASQLRHPHIVPVLDFGDSDEQLWYVMPYVATGSLRQRLEREPQLNIDDALRWSAEIADALAYAHGQGIVHRDVKPENILLDADHALLADFGIARAVGGEALDTLTSAGIAIGTAAYMSPEQATGARDIDGKSDVYSLTCVLYECLAGVAPFVGPTPQSVIAQRFAHAPHPVSSYRAALSVAVQDVIDAGFRLVPPDRPDAKELCALLRMESTAESRAVRRSGAGLAAASRPAGKHSQASQRKTVTVAMAVVVASVAIGRWFVASQPKLDSRTVVVFPMTLSTGEEAARTVAGISSAVCSALKDASAVRCEEGENLVASDLRIQGPERQAARLKASTLAGAGFFVDGTLTETGDSLLAVARLVSIRNDSVVVRASTAVAKAGGNAREAVIGAIAQLLPRLVDPKQTSAFAELTTRRLDAISAFVLGENEFRQSRYELALAHYQRAIAIDSNFAEAALKAARSARSLFREADARQFLRIAMSGKAPLRGSNASFATGLSFFYRHQADSALRYLRRAIDVAPNSSELYAALGDVYFYVGKDSINSDSAANVQYRRARDLDSTFTPALYHLAWLSARRHNPAETRGFLAEYRRGDSPDTVFIKAATIAADCQQHGVGSVPWHTLSVQSAASLEMLGKVLVGGGADLRCSAAAFRANFEKPGAPSQDQYGGLVGLNAIAMVSGDMDRVRELLNNPMAVALGARNFLVFDAMADSGLQNDAKLRASDMHSRLATLQPEELWILGAWYAAQHDRESLARTIDALRQLNARQGAKSESPPVRSLRARALLESGDTLAAVNALMQPIDSVSFQVVEWGFFASQAADNLLLAQLAARRGDPDLSDYLAQRLERSYPIMNVVFLRTALESRITIAETMRNSSARELLRHRISTLSDLAR